MGGSFRGLGKTIQVEVLGCGETIQVEVLRAGETIWVEDLGSGLRLSGWEF